MSDLTEINYCLKELWSKLAKMFLINYTVWRTIFENISSFRIPNFFWIFNLDPYLKFERCRGLIGVRVNENQLLFKGIMVQASLDVFDKIYNLDYYLWEYKLISYPKLLLDF